MSTPSVLVTGAAGFIGHHLIQHLLREGLSVIGVDNFDPFYGRDIKNRNVKDLEAFSKETQTPFEFHELDLSDLNESHFKQENILGIFHLAAKAGVRPSVEDPLGFERANVLGTLRVLEYCRQRNIPRLIFGSSSSVYGDSTPVPFGESAVCDRPISPYAATKRAGELLCATYSYLYGTRVAALRFFTVYGPRQRPDLAIHKFTRLISEGGHLVLFGDGSMGRDYTYVTDIVEGIWSAWKWSQNAEKGAYEIFNLGNSRPILLRDLVALLERLIGKKAQARWEPSHPADVQITYADLTKSQSILGYSPKIPIEAGLEKFVAWFRSK